MPIATNKEQLIDLINTNYKKLKKELVFQNYEILQIKELEAHSKNNLMSVKDLISYLVGWGDLLLKWIDRKEKSLKVDYPETGYKWNELGKLAQKFYIDYEKQSIDELIGLLDKNVEEILKIIDQKSDTELYHTAWYDKWTLGRMIQLNTASPFLNAKNRLRKWKKSKGLV
jgi:hypothetical protein